MNRKLALVFLLAFTASASAYMQTCAVPKKGERLASTCDLSFSSTPTYACVTMAQSGTYTIRNNTPVTLKIGPVQIQNNDNNSASSEDITGNTCGSSLAAGQSCTVMVTLTASGVFNRILQIGVDSRQVQLTSPIMLDTTNCGGSFSPSQPSDSFPCFFTTPLINFTTFASTSIASTGATTVNGDLGISPGTTVVGFPPGVVNGDQHINDATANTAQTDFNGLYSCMASQGCNTTIGTTDQAGATLTSSGVGAVNVFCSATSINNTGTLTLNGDSTAVFVFKAGTTLNMGAGSNIVLTGGLTAANVVWQVGSSATLGAGATFQGSIFANNNIGLGAGATVLGRTFSQNGGITYNADTLTIP